MRRKGIIRRKRGTSRVRLQTVEALLSVEELEGVEKLEQPGEADNLVNPGPSSIPANHTTGAAGLLLLPPIYKLAKDANPFKNQEPP